MDPIRLSPDFQQPSNDQIGTSANTKALVQVIIGYGNECSNGSHGRLIYEELAEYLEKRFQNESVKILESPESAYNILYVVINNELVFGCQGRYPPYESVAQAIESVLDGQAPRRILYSEGLPFNYDSRCKPHKYRC